MICHIRSLKKIKEYMEKKLIFAIWKDEISNTEKFFIKIDQYLVRYFKAVGVYILHNLIKIVLSSFILILVLISNYCITSKLLTIFVYLALIGLKSSFGWFVVLFLGFSILYFFDFSHIFSALYFIVLTLAFVLRKKYKIEGIIIQGVIIGIVAGVMGSYITNVNFRTEIDGPMVLALNKLLKVNMTLPSQEYINIKVAKLNNGTYDVDATNSVSGDTVNFRSEPLNKLPADLRYSIATGATVTTNAGPVK